jgi:hypothetical protein
MAMTTDELLEASKKTVVTKDDIKRLEARLCAAEKQFVEKSRRNAIGFHAWLNSGYTL